MKSFAAVIAVVLAIAGATSAQEASTDNTTVLKKTAARSSGDNSWIERVVRVKAGDKLSAILRDLGATPEEVKAIAAVLGGRIPDGDLREGQELRVLLSPVRGLERLQPVRIILVDDRGSEAIVALSDLGRYVRVEVFQLSMAASRSDGEDVAAKSDRLESTEVIAPEQTGDAAAATELPAVESVPEQPREIPPAAPPTAVPRVPLDHSQIEVGVKPWPVVPDASPSERYRPLNQVLHAAAGLPSERFAALPPLVQQPREPVRPKLTLPRLERPTWAWPPGRFLWAVAPGSKSVRRTWQAGWQPARGEATRVASATVLTSTSGPTLPPWVQAMAALTATDIAVPLWPRRRAPEFHVAREHGHIDVLEPPARFVRWSDRLETVVSAGDVERRCRAAGAKRPPPGKVIRGCAHFAAGRCFITRIDDPGVARHELAHCNGWKHPE